MDQESEGQVNGLTWSLSGSNFGTKSPTTSTPQVPSESMALFGLFVHNYEALVVGEFKGKGMTAEERTLALKTLGLVLLNPN